MKILLKLYFEWKTLPEEGHNQGLFSQNHGTCFQFSKKTRGGLPPPPPHPLDMCFLIF